MAQLGGHNVACCSIPPVVAAGYKPKGTYEEIGGRKTYSTGPADSTRAVLFIMDIFGYYDQTVQGADIVASSDAKKQYRVFMPNFFEGGQPADLAWFPPDNKDKEKKLGDFFTRNGPRKVADMIPDTIKAIEEQYPRIMSWAILGFCWGGKIATLSVQAGNHTPFSVAAVCHPAMVDPKDASTVSVPFALLASKDEDADAVKKFEEKLTVEKFTETYADQIHGWMGARSQLGDDKVKKDYERGYRTVVEWIGTHNK